MIVPRGMHGLGATAADCAGTADDMWIPQVNQCGNSALAQFYASQAAGLALWNNLPSTWSAMDALASSPTFNAAAGDVMVYANLAAAPSILAYYQSLLATPGINAAQAQLVQGKIADFQNGIAYWQRLVANMPSDVQAKAQAAAARLTLPPVSSLLPAFAEQFAAMTPGIMAANQQVENQYTQQQQAIIANGNQTVDYSTIPAQYQPQNIVAQPGSVTALNTPAYTGYTAPQIAAGGTSGAPGGITSLAPPAAGAANQVSVPGTVPTWVWLAGGGAVALMLFMGGGRR